MGIDNAIRAIAFAEAPTLGGALALVAKHRGELEAALRDAGHDAAPLANPGAAVERALLRIGEAARPVPVPHRIDKSA
jgi:hypothetical protein